MFLCPDCMKEKGVWQPEISYGKCAGCKREASCADIKSDKLPIHTSWLQQINSDDEMFESIKKDITERMSHYTDSRHPTGDEVRIAWLVFEVQLLRSELKVMRKDLAEILVNEF